MNLHHPLDTSVFRIAQENPANPGAGNNFSWTPPSNSRVLVLGVEFILTTDANAAGRIVTLEAREGANTFSHSLAVAGHIASLAVQHTFQPNVIGADRIGTYLHMLSVLPYPLILQVGDTLNTDILQIQVGDAITNIHIRYAAWQDV